LTWDEPELPPRADSVVVQAWLDAHPDNFAGLGLLAQALQREEKWRESLEPAKRLRELFPDNVEGASGYLLLARAYRELEELDAEHEVLEAWAARAADATDAYERLMDIAAEAGDWAAVRANAERMLSVNPLSPAPHRRMAEAAEQLGEPGAAIDSYRSLLEFDTTDPVDAHYRLASLLHERGDDGDARRHVLMALEDAPRYLDAHRLLLELSPVGDEIATEEVTSANAEEAVK
jgi:tetratricopeptide (TPR) repeat protein